MGQCDKAAPDEQQMKACQWQGYASVQEAGLRDARSARDVKKEIENRLKDGLTILLFT